MAVVALGEVLPGGLGGRGRLLPDVAARLALRPDLLAPRLARRAPGDPDVPLFTDRALLPGSGGLRFGGLFRR
ncbi:hypothetical protein ETD83_24460, partial [Actinomadura soli]